MRLLIAATLVLALAASAPGAEVPLDKIQQTIDRLVEQILACQREDGSFALGTPQPADAALFSQFPQGQTALAVMSLQYARPHLKGDRQARALEAIRKGLSNITQQRPEPRTYSAGVIVTVLYQENAERYRRLIDAYATMLAVSQQDKADIAGEWGYRLLPPPGTPGPREGLDTWGDKSNTQFALLGLYNAQRAGFQVPKVVWQRAAEHYLKAQYMDGGWGYNPILRQQPYMNMTLASTISLNLCEEMLYAGKHQQCKPPPRSKAVEGGLNWIAINWEKSNIGLDPYGLYALERLGILMGRANIGGHDWYNEGAEALLNAKQISSWGTAEVAYCFAVAYLARGLEPIVVNKLERRDTNDWNNDPYDVKHLVEFLQDHYQLAVQWRIVTLDAPLDLLARTPILYISGHNKLDFNDAEKKKLKAYVDGGGTILAQSCCGKVAFDKSIRELTKELFSAEFQDFPKTSRLFERMKIRGVEPNPEVLYAALEAHQGRPVVIYFPHDLCCRWHAGGSDARSSLAAGAGVYFFVTNEGRRMYLKVHPEAEVKPPEPKPETPEPPQPGIFGPTKPLVPTEPTPPAPPTPPVPEPKPEPPAPPAPQPPAPPEPKPEPPATPAK